MDLLAWPYQHDYRNPQKLSSIPRCQVFIDGSMLLWAGVVGADIQLPYLRYSMHDYLLLPSRYLAYQVRDCMDPIYLYPLVSSEFLIAAEVLVLDCSATEGRAACISRLTLTAFGAYR